MVDPAGGWIWLSLGGIDRVSPRHGVFAPQSLVQIFWFNAALCGCRPCHDVGIVMHVLFLVSLRVLWVCPTGALVGR